MFFRFWERSRDKWDWDKIKQDKYQRRDILVHVVSGKFLSNKSIILLEIL